ncbi:unnamed protein product, partial [Trichobilharzia regenti]
GSDDSQPQDVDDEQYNNEEEDYGDEETDRQSSSMQNAEVHEIDGAENQRLNEDDGQSHYEDSYAEKNDQSLSVSAPNSQGVSTTSDSDIQTTTSTKGLFGGSSIPSIFGASSFSGCSSSSVLGSSGLFSGFKPSSFTVSSTVVTTESGQLSSGCAGLFKSFLPVNTVSSSTTSVLLFKPSAYTSTMASPKETTNTADSGTNRPKIQPIVWDSFDPSTSQSTVPDNTSTISPTRRKKWGPITSMPRTTRRPSLPSTRGCVTGRASAARGVPPRRG